jgi:predicted dinucleotide-binding enzyme
MNITIIGEGKTPEVLATGLAEAEHEIFLATTHKNYFKNSDLFYHFDNVYNCSIEEASAASDIIIITAHSKDVREIAYRIDDVRNKIVIDASQISTSRTVESINTYKAIQSITGSKNVIRCFNLVGYDNLLNLFYKDKAIDLFMAGDCKKAKETVKLLARDMGYTNCYDFGDDQTIPLLEDMARCMITLSKKHKGADLPFMLIRK